MNSKKIFIIGDIQGEVPIAESFSFLLEKESPDLLLINGDVSNFTSFDPLGLAERVLDKLEMGNVKIFAVPGNHDSKDIRDALSIYGLNIHEDWKIVDGIGIIGFGGAKTPFDTPFEPEDIEMEESIVKSYNEIQDSDEEVDKIIILAHNPPYNTKCDKLVDGKHVGSKKLRQIIERLEPDVVIGGHIHEAAAVDKIGKTIVMNPGPLAHRKYGIVDIDDDGNIETRLLEF